MERKVVSYRFVEQVLGFSCVIRRRSRTISLYFERTWLAAGAKSESFCLSIINEPMYIQRRSNEENNLGEAKLEEGNLPRNWAQTCQGEDENDPVHDAIADDVDERDLSRAAGHISLPGAIPTHLASVVRSVAL